MIEDPKPSLWSLKNLKEKVQEHIPNVSLPTLPTFGSEVELPVFLVHNSNDPEDYFFIFDFEEFVEASKRGVFVRPKIKVWAGRSDFGRREFARQFRESFAREFDLARQQLSEQQSKQSGWFGFLKDNFGELRGSFSAFAAYVLLLVALSAGRMVLSQILPQTWLVGKSDERKLEESINDVQNKVDAALQDVVITLHPELYRHAHLRPAPTDLEGMDHEAWPLPDYVKKHLDA